MGYLKENDCFQGLRGVPSFSKVVEFFSGGWGVKMLRGSCMVWEINMGVCPRLDFDNIM